jgi:hypothetical protein
MPGRSAEFGFDKELEELGYSPEWASGIARKCWPLPGYSDHVAPDEDKYAHSGTSQSPVAFAFKLFLATFKCMRMASSLICPKARYWYWIAPSPMMWKQSRRERSC